MEGKRLKYQVFLATLLIQRARRLAARIIITNTNEAAQAKAF
jgi:hypothetical protein